MTILDTKVMSGAKPYSNVRLVAPQLSIFLRPRSEKRVRIKMKEEYDPKVKKSDL